MTPQQLPRLFDVSYNALMINLEEVTEEESLINPEPAGNHLNWLLGHIVASRGLILGLAGGKAVLNKKEAFIYRRGANPKETNEFVAFDRLKEAMTESHERLTLRLEEMTEEDLLKEAKPFTKEGKPGPLIDKLTFLNFHEAYHVGQVGLMRRLIGRKGQIK